MLIFGPEDANAHLKSRAQVGIDHTGLEIANAYQIHQDAAESSFTRLGEPFLLGDSGKPALRA